MKPLSIARGTLVKGFIDLLTSVGHPVERSLHKFLLPSDWDQIDRVYVPLLPSVQMVTAAEAIEGIFDIGFSVARQMHVGHLGNRLRAAIYFAPTLNAALHAFCNLAPLENNLLQIQLKKHGSDTRICSTLSGTAEMLNLEHSQWLQNMMAIYIVREFAGPDWMPTTFAFEARYTPTTETQAQFPNTRFLSGQNESWIDVHASLLSLPKHRTSRIETICAFDASPPPVDFSSIRTNVIDQLKLVLPPYLEESTLKIGMLAEIAGTSARTLQRRLNAVGMSYSELLNQVRFEKGADLLRNSDAKIIDVAIATGYSDPAHFTRAFRRIAGVSPREYRVQYRSK